MQIYGALTAPKLAINDTIMALDSMPNSFLPISGTTVCSSPIIAPTKAFTKTRIRNCWIFACKPSVMRLGLSSSQLEFKYAPLNLKLIKSLMKLKIVQTNLDKTDTLIINSLMQDGRKSFRQIAREIGVSTPTMESHFSRMMGLGIIKNIVPILDSERIEKQTSAFVYLKIDHPSQTLIIANKVSSIPEIKNVYLLTGEYNLMFKVIADKPEHVEEIVRTRIAIIKGVSSSTIQVVTRTIKESQSVTIKEGIPITIKCDYCNNDVLKNSKTLQVGQYERNFCCNSCLTLYKQKYKGRIDALSK